jgi:acyl dehydratase
MSGGPYFEDLSVGQRFPGAPGCTLSAGRAAVHQAVVGDRLRLPLDDDLAAAVTGRSPIAHPGLVWDVAIGQSTVVTPRVRANLFYRDLVLLRLPAIGDTLRTVTTVTALRQNSRREGRPPTGLAVLRVTSVDQRDRPVLDFSRCAMLPLRQDVDTGHRDDLDRVGGGAGHDPLASVTGWDLDRWRSLVPAGPAPVAGEVIEVAGGDVVSCAPELARLTLNLARVHHDDQAGDGAGRLVYGGHTIGIALSQVCRALPDLVTVLGWRSCDHVGPVREGDTLRSTITVDAVRPIGGAGGAGGRPVELRCQVVAGPARRPVLDWRFTALVS